MCEFCDNINSFRSKKIKWSVRSFSADNNLDEILDPCFSGEWSEDYCEFGLFGYEYKDKVYVGVDYRQEVHKNNEEKLIIDAFSETIPFSFCPFCGIQLSKEIVSFEDISDYYITVEEKQ